MNAFPENSTIVLVHGAWADGSCWTNVILPLRRHGLGVICAPIPLTSLADDVAALGRALERMPGPVVLAGHAYAGAVIGATREDRVKSLVYVAALAPDNRETVARVLYRDDPHPDAPKLTPDKHGFIWMPEEGFRRAVGVGRPNSLHGCSTTTHRASVHSRASPGAGMESEAVVVSAGRRRPND
jgi:pimeloyl-ACP methyl ester carboxylesterase